MLATDETMTNTHHQNQMDYRPDDDEDTNDRRWEAETEPIPTATDPVFSAPEQHNNRPKIHRRNRRSQITVAAGRYRKNEGLPIGHPDMHLIDDVYPTLPMKVYGLEKDVARVQEDLKRHIGESVEAGKRNERHFATREGLDDLEKGIYTDIGDLRTRMDKRTGLVVLQTVGLLVSMAYALILSYKHFIQ